MRLRARPCSPDARSPEDRVAPRARRLALGAACLAALAGLASAPERPPNRADNRIRAKLDGESKRNDGSLELRGANNSGEAGGELWLHR
jgi:hypothetical protein